MEYTSNNDKMLQAVLLDEKLMKYGGYTPADISDIYQALDSDNCIINTVAQIIKRTEEGSSETEIWKIVKNYLSDNI